MKALVQSNHAEMIRRRDMEMIKLTDLFAKIRDAVNDREASLKKNYLKRVEDTFEYFQKDKSTINKAFD